MLVSDVTMAAGAETPAAAKTVNVVLKGALLAMLAQALVDPEGANLQGKAAELRAIGYPVAAFVVPLTWWLAGRERAFPWLADLLITITCFTDIFGNRLDLYDTVVWFDDWMHFMNTGLLAAAIVLLTMPVGVTLGAVLERSLAFGSTAAIAWEVAEYFAFIARSTERTFAYTDTLGDLALGVLGALVAGCVVHWARRPVDQP